MKFMSGRQMLALLALTLFAIPALARIDAYPSMLRFQDTTVGRRSLPQQVTVINRDARDIPSVQISGVCGGSFDVQQATCLGLLRANQSCYINVSFVPVREGPQSCSITISTPGSAAETVTVSGRGVKQKPAFEMSTDEQNENQAVDEADETWLPLDMAPDASDAAGAASN